MSNLLGIPSKKTYQLDVIKPTRQFITDYNHVHPDEFRQDMKKWQDLRDDVLAGSIHESQVTNILLQVLYHAQLVSILAKLPADIGLSISYSPVFNPSAIPITLNNLVFERASLLFNLASLYTQLAIAEDRTSTEGIKKAAQAYNNAAGTFSYLSSTVLPRLVLPSNEEAPEDLSLDFIKSLEFLCLAQAQECAWQLAKLNQVRNNLIAKISTKVSGLYGSAASKIKDLSYSLRRSFPSDWLPHIEAKQHHFAAVAEFRESLVENEAGRYGNELARLERAQQHAKKAYDVALRGKVSTPVLRDVKSLLEVVESNYRRAERDNDLVYHKDVPAASSLPAIQEVNALPTTTPKGLVDLSSVLGQHTPLFKELAGWGAQEAIGIYENRKQNLIQEKIVDASQELQDHAKEQLRNLNLPASLEALERPIGLPPSLLSMAEEVRTEDGPQRIEETFEDVERLAQQNQEVLNEALDILDEEASEDEAVRNDVPLNRLRSHEANGDLTKQAERYRNILTQAAETDELVRQKWEEWEDSIRELTLDEEVLEAAVPSSTLSDINRATPHAQQTRQHSRSLRAKLEDLEALHRDRSQIVHRAKKAAEADQIRDRVLAAADAIRERRKGSTGVSSGEGDLVEVTPEMLEDVLDEELSKYDRFLVEMGETERKQKDLLEEIQNLNKLFLDSRKDDPVIKEREQALLSLDLAYSKYREITRNLEEGFEFYTNLAGILNQFKEVCRVWTIERNQELRALLRSQKLPAAKGEPRSPDVPVSTTSSATPPPQAHPPAQTTTKGLGSASTSKGPHGRSNLGLPSLNSDEWEFEEVKLPPPPPNRFKK